MKCSIFFLISASADMSFLKPNKAKLHSSQWELISQLQISNNCK